MRKTHFFQNASDEHRKFETFLMFFSHQKVAKERNVKTLLGLPESQKLLAIGKHLWPVCGSLTT